MWDSSDNFGNTFKNVLNSESNHVTAASKVIPPAWRCGEQYLVTRSQIWAKPTCYCEKSSDTMNCVIVVKDLFSFVFLVKQQCPELFERRIRRGRLRYRLKESHLKWGWLTHDGSAQPASNERIEKKRKSLLDVLNHFTLQPTRDWMGFVICLIVRLKCVNGNTLDWRHRTRIGGYCYPKSQSLTSSLK